MENFEVVGLRFKQYIDNKAIGNNQAAKKLGFSGSQVSNIVNGKVFGADKLFKILIVFDDLNPAWWLRGIGKMLLASDSSNDHVGLSEPSEIYYYEIDKLNRRIAELEKDKELLSEIIRKKLIEK